MDRASEDRFNRALMLVVSMAQGETEPADVATHLRNEGHDDLDEMVATLGQAARQAVDPASLYQPIDPSDFSRPNPPELFAETIYRSPQQPFLNEGTLYDPQDIVRFNGRVWELLYITAVIEPARDYTPVTPLPLLTDDMGPVPWWDLWPEVDEDEVGAHFWGHAYHGDWGAHLFLPSNYGYRDLMQVCRGLFCTDDWNDKISSFRCWSQPPRYTRVCKLFEHAGP